MARALALPTGGKMSASEVELLGLYRDLMAGSRTETGTVRHGLMASTRPDMAGTAVNDLLLPYTYQQKTMKVWEGYNVDPFFKRLIDRSVEFAANGAQWELPADRGRDSWTKTVQKWLTKGKDYEREGEFWSTWADSINEGVADTLPGMDIVSDWMVKHLLLSGMFVPAVKLGVMKFGKQEFVVPTEITCYSAAAVALAREREIFGKERLWLRLPPGMKSIPLREGEPNVAQEFLPFVPKGMHNLGIYQELPTFGELAKAPGPGKTAAMAVKFKWSPGDLSSTRGGRVAHAGTGVYPVVPHYGLLPQLALRSKMFAADLALLDGVINYIMMYKIGDVDHPPQPPKYKAGKLEFEGTIAQVKRLIQEGRVGPAMELFLPYYVDLKITMPDTSILMAETKYVQSSIEMFQAFGIFFPRGTGAREKLERLNIAGFEEMLNYIRMYLRTFWTMLARLIVKINGGKLATIPRWTPNPLNTKSDAFNAALLELAKFGRISVRTLLRYHGINDDVELARIASEQGTDVPQMMDANLPVSYKQSVEPPDYHKGADPTNEDEIDDDAPAAAPAKTEDKTTTTAITPLEQKGRPKKTTKTTSARRSPGRPRKS